MKFYLKQALGTRVFGLKEGLKSHIRKGGACRKMVEPEVRLNQINQIKVYTEKTSQHEKKDIPLPLDKVDFNIKKSKFFFIV